MKKNHEGFSALEGLLILIIVSILGFTGWYVWHSTKQTDETLNSAASQKNEPATNGINKTLPIPNTNHKYLVIKEWGVKIGFNDADKVLYRLSSDKNMASLYLTPRYSPVISCQALGAGFIRSTMSHGDGDYFKIGNYYYSISGGPGACSDDPGGANGSINQLRGKIDGQEFGTARYTITAI